MRSKSERMDWMEIMLGRVTDDACTKTPSSMKLGMIC